MIFSRVQLWRIYCLNLLLIYVVAELFQQQTDTKGVILKLQVKTETALCIVKELLQFLISLTDDFHVENRSNCQV